MPLERNVKDFDNVYACTVPINQIQRNFRDLYKQFSTLERIIIQFFYLKDRMCFAWNYSSDTSTIPRNYMGWVQVDQTITEMHSLKIRRNHALAGRCLLVLNNEGNANRFTKGLDTLFPFVKRLRDIWRCFYQNFTIAVSCEIKLIKIWSKLPYYKLFR